MAIVGKRVCVLIIVFEVALKLITAMRSLVSLGELSFADAARYTGTGIEGILRYLGTKKGEPFGSPLLPFLIVWGLARPPWIKLFSFC